MIDEPLARGSSWIHALDPRVRLLVCLLLSLIAAVSQGMGSPLLILTGGLLCTVTARPPVGLVWKRACAVNAFIVFLWLVVPMTAPGEPIGRVFGFGISREGVHLALLVTVKANAVFFCVLSLLATIPAPALGQAMTNLGVPDKFCFLFLFTYRYLYVIAEEYERLATAARLRGFVAATDMRTYRTYAALVAMVLVKSFDRSQRVYQAMLLRGFAGRFPSLGHDRAGRRDAVFLTLALGLAAAAVWLEYVWRTHG